MNSECQKYKDKIIDFVSGLLEESEIESLQQHLDECKECREYTNILKSEDKLLTDFFTQVDSDVQNREQKVLDAINTPEQKETGSRIKFRPLIKLAAAAAIIFIVLFGLEKFTNTSIVWADVVERFKSVKYFNASIYIKQDLESAPELLELWMNNDGRVRILSGKEVIFAENGRAVKAFDIKSRKETEADSRYSFLISSLGSSGNFSLQTVINTFSQGKLEDVTPKINSDEIISQDVVVFDIVYSDFQWIRIWALKESKLPIRIKGWTSVDGELVDVVLSYDKQQSDTFFDPNAFEQYISGRFGENLINIAYAFLADPGGKDVTPQDRQERIKEEFQEKGFHMPVIKCAGITESGAFWVIAEKTQNKIPDGWNFQGFSKLEDNLGRTYSRIYNDYDYNSDKSLSVFVPIDFPFDEKRPSKVTLTCDTGKYHPEKEPIIVGTIDLTQWETSDLCPQLNGSGTKSDLELKISLAWNLTNAENTERLERLLDSIPGEPENNNFAYDREKVRLRMLLNNKKYDEAVILGDRLMPLLDKEYRPKRYLDPFIFNDYMKALTFAGKLDKTEETWKYIISIEPDLNNVNKNSQKYYKDRLNESLETCLRVMVPDFSREAQLTIDQINKIFGIEIRNNELFQHYTFWDWNPYYEEPIYDFWREHLKELGEYYKTHSLPLKMELLPVDENKEMQNYLAAVPDNPDYRVEFISRTIMNLFSPCPWYYGSRYSILQSILQIETAAQLKLSEELADIKLHHDLVYEKNVTEKERSQFILDKLGLEIVEVNIPRKVWIAHYDGRKLKPFEDIEAPVSVVGGNVKAGYPQLFGSFSISDLFNSFMRYQNKDLEADCIIIIDETGIKSVPDENETQNDIAVSRIGPNWEGPEAPEIARKWFHDEFGVSFIEETRMMKTYVIQKREE